MLFLLFESGGGFEESQKLLVLQPPIVNVRGVFFREEERKDVES